MYSIDQLILIMIRGTPSPELIKRVDTVTDENAIRFSYLGETYRVSKSLSVDVCKDGMLTYNDTARSVSSAFKAAARVLRMNGDL